MDYKRAFEILEIPSDIDINKLNLNYLKKKYHKLALQNHPDKNGNTIESNERFKQINESYNYLKREIKYLNIEIEDDNLENELNNEDVSVYQLGVILKQFINSFFEDKYSDIIKNLIADIVTGCKKISLKLFEDLDKDKLLNIYTFLSKYKIILYLDESILEDIKKIMIQKYSNVLLYKLNPSINDMLNDNIYKLYIDNKLYLVPLWFNESYFQNDENEIIVICEPELPDNIKIDEDNNIYVDIKYNISSDTFNKIINNENISFYLGDKEINIPLSELYMKSEQYYRIKNKGLLKQDVIDLYNISNKSDVIVKIILE
jgi:curved DNA-binding protein CbpA